MRICKLSPRTLNCLKRANINRVGEVLEKSDEDLLKIRNFGEKSLFELQEKLAERGIVSGRWGMQPPSPSVASSAYSAEDLDDLMGGGGAEVANLPAGMSFAGAEDALDSLDDSEAVDFPSGDYEED